MTHTAEEVRAQFETWAKSRHLDLALGADSWGSTIYKHPFIEAMWDAWKSAYADLLERREAGLTTDVVNAALKEFRRWADREDTVAMDAALHLVWPVAAEPAQPADSGRVDEIDPRVVAAFNVIGDWAGPKLTDAIESALAAQGQPAKPVQTCTCPSGDGSLRWPRPVHPPAERVPEGWVLVPCDMTAAQEEAMVAVWNQGPHAVREAMLTAAPQPGEPS